MPEEQKKEVRNMIRDELAILIGYERLLFQKDIIFADGRTIKLGSSAGNKIGTASTQKLGLWGTTPVVQPTAIADVAGGGADSDGTARAKINVILAALRLPGFIDT